MKSPAAEVRGTSRQSGNWYESSRLGSFSQIFINSQTERVLESTNETHVQRSVCLCIFGIVELMWLMGWVGFQRCGG